VDGSLGRKEIRKSLDLRDWQKAQDLVRGWEAKDSVAAQPEADAMPLTIEQACERFLGSKQADGLREASLYKYRLLCRELREFADVHGLSLLNEFDINWLDEYRASWRNKNISAKKKLERLRAFFRFAEQRELISDNPAASLRNPIITSPPTLPFEPEEMTPILAACDIYAGKYPRAGEEYAKKLKALVLLLRYSGLRIRDAVTLRRADIKDGCLFLYTQKTNVPVRLPLPPSVIEALEAIHSACGQYFFWTGTSKAKSAVGDWQRSLKKLFQLAGVLNGHAHRFRDTFAVDLLVRNVSLEDVSILLGHESVKTTQRHYAPWVHARQARLEACVRRTWEEADEASAEGKGYAKGTQEMRGR
jgi:integrase